MDVGPALEKCRFNDCHVSPDSSLTLAGQPNKDVRPDCEIKTARIKNLRHINKTGSGQQFETLIQ